MPVTHKNIEEKTEQLLIPIAEAHGVQIYDVEYVKEAGEYYLRAFIDKEGGVTIDDCVAVSHALSDALDTDDFIDDAYTLEVSSPGLTRALKKERHFAASIGKLIDVKLYQARNGEKELSGTLTGFDEGNITLSCAEEEVSLPRKEIASVRLAFEESPA